jgi:hypothetical protein
VERNTKMRLLVATLALALLAGPVCAQSVGGMGGGGGKGGGKGKNAAQNNDQQKDSAQKNKAADDAFKAAMKRIPDPKEKYDPWRVVR